MDYTQAVWTALGGNLVMLAALAWLCKWWLKKQSARDIESFKGGIQEKLAGVTAELQSINKKQEIQFNVLHEERAAVIKEYYTRLIALGRNFDSAFISLLFNDKEKQQRVCGEVLAFSDFHEENQIYFDQATAKKIAIIISQFLALHAATTVDCTDREIGEIRGEIAELISLLREDFRLMLGVEKKAV